MNGKMRSTDRVRQAAEAAGLAISIREMPQSTRTAEEAAAACGTSVGQIVKSLIFRKAQPAANPCFFSSPAPTASTTGGGGPHLGEALERMDADAVR